MYVIKILSDGLWVSWGSAASLEVINQYVQLLKRIDPKAEWMIEGPK